MAPLNVSGEVRVPGDKSISHRALMLSALATGTSHVRGILRSADVQSTAAVLRTLGVDVPDLDEDVLRIAGRGRRGLQAPAATLDCGNSGTTTRLMAGVCAGFAFESRFVGDASLSRRPMRRVARPLEAMGAQVLLSCDGLPMTVRGGALRPVVWRSEKSSAQIKSAILLAAVVAGVEATVREPEQSRDHSERMLRAAGVTVSTDQTTVTVSPADTLRPLDIAVPGDPSSAAFFAALAVLCDRGELLLPGVGVNPTRTGFYDALRRMGARIRVEGERREGDEPVGTIVASASGGSLRATAAGGAEIPTMIDELPLLACVAARAVGTTEITGAAELRVKESDRIAAVVANLRTLGVDAEELVDGLRVTGSDRPLRGHVVTHGDHRLAMAFGVLGALPGNEITIDDPDCAIVSFPGFWELLARVTGRGTGSEPGHRARSSLP
ncbi:MAG: 3-phosphoshikimate 1-carboxyvinyltransferase [Gemmatimonadaceae bacterium]